jgi:hypothetical protein
MQLGNGGSERRVKADLMRFLSVILAAEIVSSWRLWGGAPTDTIRISYSGFWNYESGRLFYWAPLLLLCILLWFLIARAVMRPRSHANAGQGYRSITSGWFWIPAFGIALALEISTTVLYWKSAASMHVRNLYESIWYWHRIPQSSDLGWPSLEGYLLDHLVIWFIMFLFSAALWYYLRRAARKSEKLSGHATES